MKKTLFTMSTLALIVSISACTSASKKLPKYNIDKNTNIQHIKRSIELQQSRKGNKATAVALDKEGKYVIGYAYDAASIESAKKIALQQCREANRNAEVSADAPCAIYTINNQQIKKLK